MSNHPCQKNQSMCKHCYIHVNIIVLCFSHRNIGDVIRRLRTRKSLKANGDFVFEMVVRRGDILSDALRRMERLAFDPNKPMKVLCSI